MGAPWGPRAARPGEASIRNVGHGQLWLFLLGEIYAALAAFGIYCVSHMLAYFTEWVTASFPVRADGPDLFLSTLLSWIGAVGSVVGFTVITLYQLRVLIRRSGQL